MSWDDMSNFKQNLESEKLVEKETPDSVFELMDYLLKIKKLDEGEGKEVEQIKKRLEAIEDEFLVSIGDT